MCTKDLKYLMIETGFLPPKYLMGFEVVDNCPFGYVERSRVCHPFRQKKTYNKSNMLSIRCLDSGGTNPITEFEEGPAHTLIQIV